MTIELGTGGVLTGLLILLAVFEALAVVELRRALAVGRTNARRHQALVRFVSFQLVAGAMLCLAIAVAFGPPRPVVFGVLLGSAVAAVAVALRVSYRSWLGTRVSSPVAVRLFAGHQIRRLHRLYVSANGDHEHVLPAAKSRPWRGRLIAVGCVLSTVLLVDLLSEVRAMTPTPDDPEFTSTLITKIATVWAGSLIICATPVVFLTWVVVAGVLSGRPSVRVILRRASDAIGSCTAFGLLSGALVVGWNVAGFADAAVTPSIAVDWILDLSIGGVVVGFGVAHFTTLDQISRSTPNRITGWLATLAAVYLTALVTTIKVLPARAAQVLIEGAAGGVVAPADPGSADDAGWQAVLAASRDELSESLPSGAGYALGLTLLLAVLFLGSFRSWMQRRDRFATAVEAGHRVDRRVLVHRAAALAAVVVTYLAATVGLRSRQSWWEPLDTALLCISVIDTLALLIVGITAAALAIAARRASRPTAARLVIVLAGLAATCVLLPTVGVAVAEAASQTDLIGWGGIAIYRVVGWLLIALTVGLAVRYLARRVR